MTPYWPDGEPAWPGERTLLENDLGSARRLSAFAFEKRFGFDLDLVDLSAHLFATEQATPDLVLPETIWRQRLRGVAATAFEAIRDSRAEIAFIPHGAEVVSRILADVAARLGLRVLFWESGFFPGFLYVDPRAPHFFRGEASIDALEAPSSPTARARAFRDEWRAKRQSKYPQTAATRQAFSEWLATDPRPVIFFPGQVPIDANAVVGLGAFATLDDLYRETLNHIPAEWRVLYKPHPLAPRDPLSASTLPADRFLSLDIDIHDAIAASDVVLAHSSNVGLEALLLGKPVLLLGRPIYAGRGLTVDLESPDGISTLLARGAPAAAPPEAILAFLDLALDHALIADGDAAALSLRIERSMPGAPQRPRLSWYPDRVRALAQATRAVHESLRVKVRLDRALESTDPEHVARLGMEVGLDALEPHRFGGPAAPRSRYVPPVLPNLDPLLGVEAHYSDLRLGECVDPVAALKHARPAQGVHSLFCFGSPETDEASVQALSLEEAVNCIAEAWPGFTCRGLGYRMAGSNEFHRPAHVLLVAPQSEPPPGMPEPVEATSVRPWWLPAEAFEAPAGERKDGGICLTRSRTRHPTYGPYLAVPAGRWKITPRRRSLPPRGIWRSILQLGARPRLNLEVVEHRDGEAVVVAQAPLAAASLVFAAREDSRYEFRTTWVSRRQNPPRMRRDIFEGMSLTRLTDNCSF